MSAATLTRITAEPVGRLEGVDRVENPTSFLSELITAFARDNAETVFFKVHTEPCWTDDEVQQLADRVLERSVLGFTETLNAHGGTLEQALHLGEIAVAAYSERFAELSAKYEQGGAA